MQASRRLYYPLTANQWTETTWQLVAQNAIVHGKDETTCSQSPSTQVAPGSTLSHVAPPLYSHPFAVDVLEPAPVDAGFGPVQLKPAKVVSQEYSDTISVALPVVIASEAR